MAYFLVVFLYLDVREGLLVGFLKETHFDLNIAEKKRQQHEQRILLSFICVPGQNSETSRIRLLSKI